MGSDRRRQASRARWEGMAPAMSTTIKPEAVVEWRGEGVSMSEVLDALNNIRKTFALAEAQDAEQPHPRNCVMTLVAVASTDAEERRAQRATRAIGNLSLIHISEPTRLGMRSYAVF